MSNVTLSIGGRRFTIACADGEEAHVIDLSRTVDAKVAQSGSASQTETRMLLYAALMLADELHETQRELANASPAPLPSPEIATRAERIALRLEALAQKLEGRHLDTAHLDTGHLDTGHLEDRATTS